MLNAVHVLITFGLSKIVSVVKPANYRAISLCSKTHLLKCSSYLIRYPIRYLAVLDLVWCVKSTFLTVNSRHVKFKCEIYIANTGVTHHGDLAENTHFDSHYYIHNRFHYVHHVNQTILFEIAHQLCSPAHHQH